jgi:MoaA/NifB/PqqE/SkfB family radical SAM enzyme
MEKSLLIRKGLTHLRAVAAEELYLKTGFDATFPISFVAEVNERCNYKCQYCHYWRMEKYAEEMSAEEWKAALLDIREFVGRYSIQFLGGEPFIKKGFTDLLLFCREHEIDWGVITNGSAFTQSIVDKVIQARPSNINVSVDSADAQINDAVRGAPGSLAKIGAGLQRLRAARDASGRYFPIRIKPTVTRMSFRSLPRLTQWAVDHGADSVDLHPVHTVPFWTPELRTAMWVPDHEIQEFRDVIETLIEQQRNGAPIETPADKLRSYADQFQGKTVKPSIDGPCRTGMRHLTILSTGKVVQCFGFPSLGNVRARSVRDIWNSEEARSIREDTTKCSRMGKDCANGCRDSRSLKQEIERVVLFYRRREKIS